MGKNLAVVVRMVDGKNLRKIHDIASDLFLAILIYDLNKRNHEVLFSSILLHLYLNILNLFLMAKEHKPDQKPEKDKHYSEPSKKPLKESNNPDTTRGGDRVPPPKK
jgi:hypothetical protein